MHAAEITTKSEIDTEGPIDFEKLELATQSIGPLRSRWHNTPYTVLVGVYPCGCEDEGCEEKVVKVWRHNGLFSIFWVLSLEDLGRFDSLDSFTECVLKGGFDDSRGERMVIEQRAEQEFGVPYHEIHSFACICGTCAGAAGEDGIWRRMLLAQLSECLKVRDEYLEYGKEHLGDELEQFISNVFDLGYSTGRIFSEYQVKRDIEPQALVGLDFQEVKAKRAKSAGEKSANMRHERMRSLLSHMERLASESPSILRIGPIQLAKLACEDAAIDKPLLWVQGSGQVEEYVGKIRRGEVGADMRNRYFTLFPDKARHGPKTV